MSLQAEATAWVRNKKNKVAPLQDGLDSGDTLYSHQHSSYNLFDGTSLLINQSKSREMSYRHHQQNSCMDTSVNNL